MYYFSIYENTYTCLIFEGKMYLMPLNSHRICRYLTFILLKSFFCKYFLSFMLFIAILIIYPIHYDIELT